MRLSSPVCLWFHSNSYRDRFKSEPVESDAYLLTVIRYVHWNPVKAGLCSTLEAYPYGSYAQYYESQGMIDNTVIAGMMGGVEFKEFHSTPGKEECLVVREGTKQRVTDPELLTVSGGIVQGMSGSPLIQDGRLIGAVTHVMVNDPTMGYGICIDAMLEAAEKAGGN